jgi:hypothetical protein
LSNHINEKLETEVETVGRGGGVSVETILDETDGIEGPKSFTSIIVTAYVALGTRSTTCDVDEGKT